MLQAGEDVDCRLIPRAVRVAGGVWRVLAKPATREAEFRERLAQFLAEEGRTLDDLARLLEKGAPPPPRRPPKPPEPPRARRAGRVPRMAPPPPPRLVVGTYDSSNASDSSEGSEFEASASPKPGGAGRGGPARGRRARRMPVSYLGSKFLGSDLDSEDDEELVAAFLRQGDQPPPGARARRPRGNPLVPGFEDGPGRRPARGDRWRELKRRVRGWAPGSGPAAGEAPRASVRVGRDEGPCSARPGEPVGSAEGGPVPEAPPRRRRWRPKIKWASFRLRRREEAASGAQGAEAAGDQRAEAAGDQGAEAVGDQRVEVASDQRAEAVGDQGAEAAGDQGAEAVGDQRVEVASDQRAEAVGDQGAEAAGDQRVEAVGDQGAEAAGDQRAEAAGDQRAEAVGDQGAEAPVVQGAEAASDGAQARAGQRAEASAEAAAFAAPGAPGAQKQVQTVRFQTPGRFAWFRKRPRAFWHTARLPPLPKGASRAGEAGGLRVLRAEAGAEAEPEEQEDPL
ncbi:coiled-coil domain-containing protein 8 isoform X1 [Pipistrellus kuhlii]|uniref:coiled-coil domain-containing protein 8 isoform X1 n=1 Tax=Pipistrellus kuhlii TaxID=59472 RepID=UPI001E271DBD|nr:coiled-coil domain-containing protein 8 isoform X1 [Pipistrellus kuhlii]